MVVKTQGRVLEHKELVPNIKYLKIEASEIARCAKPGQFVQVKCSTGYSPLLRKPLSIHGIDSKNGTIGLLYEIKGLGTQNLAKLKEGESIDLVGPLGNGFTLPSRESKVLLVGGGMGIAPLLPLAAALRKQDNGITVVLGFNNAGRVCRTESFAQEADRVIVTTLDGSYGEKGLVTGPMTGLIEQGNIDVVYACGPEPMLEAVARIAEKQQVECQVSLESYMACGVGACLGCVCVTRRQNGTTHARVCTEGPVFDSREVVWNEG